MATARIGLGLVGTGRMGAILARAIARRVPGAYLVGVADVDLAAARRLADELGVDTVCASGAELAAHPDVAGVVIAVSSARHLEAVRQAAAAGRDIFCEKPLALTVADTMAAIEAAATAGVRLQVGFMRRFDAAYRRGFGRLARGEIGRPIMVKCLQFDPGPPPPAQADPAVSGGIHVDMGIHEYDLVRWLMSDEVREVHAWGSAIAYPNLAAVGDVDSAVVSLRFAGGATGSVLLARSASAEDVRTEIVGERGTIAIGRRPAPPRSSPTAVGWGTGPLRFEGAYAAEIRAFVRAMSRDEPVAVDGADSLAALRIALAADRSMREGRPIVVADA
ncbi:MAG TPA: Gfo/Idh/MocA family oxidoreductase [Candidatus Limnocylindrales bacterium]|nr:Gfo/Idh/MocA family oxidoreductase [Candidatus Limnocylindrales bacterium]